jgi:sorting nexin-29
VIKVSWKINTVLISLEKLPDEWKRSIICPVHKKDDLLECVNYRGISLLNTAYKALSNIICARLLPYTEAEIGSYQYGFRPGKSTTDALFILRQILEKALERKIETLFLFIDFKEAYDSVIRMHPYKAVDELGIPGKLTRMVRVTEENIMQHACADLSRCNIWTETRRCSGLPPF